MQGGCISGKVLRQQLRLQQPEGSGLGDMLPSEEQHHASREDAEFARQEVDIGDRLRFIGAGVRVESSQTAHEAAPQ